MSILRNILQFKILLKVIYEFTLVKIIISDVELVTRNEMMIVDIELIANERDVW